jgi:hypothetical protein
MKRLTAVILFTVICSALFAQKDIPSFGKIDKADLQMIECSFDKSADAMVLFDVAEVYCFLDMNSSTKWLSSQREVHVRIKIFNSKGFDHANIHIPYISDKNMEDIRNLSAQTINLDESGNIVISKVEKQMIYTKKKNKRYSEVVFAFPNVKAGSIIEYKYKDEAEFLYALSNWYFQNSIPVKYSRYILNFPSELVISAQPQGGLAVNRVETNEINRNIKTFSMSDVPALKSEPFMSSKYDYLQQVVPFLYSFNLPGVYDQSLLQTWPKIVKKLMEHDDFGIQLKKNIPRTHDLDVMLENISDPYRKMVIIHDYVKKNMEWNNIYGIWAQEGIKPAWRDKKGTTGEINLILVNLLKDADLKAYPILLSLRKNGKVNTMLADIDAFDKVMAYVSIGDKNFILDATDKNTPPQLIPLEVLNMEGLVIEKYDTYEWGWKSLSDKEHSFETITDIEAVIDSKGVMTGNAKVYSVDYSRLERIPQLKENKDKFIQNYFTSNENDLKVDSFSFENTDIDSLPLIQSCKFSQHINSSGGYNYFTANLFSGLKTNPFIEDERISDVFIGANQITSIDGVFTIPEGYSFDVLPKSSKMRLPDTSIVFTRYVSTEGRKLSVRLQLEFKKPVYSSDEYGMLQEFYKKLFTMLNEQFVFKKD